MKTTRRKRRNQCTGKIGYNTEDIAYHVLRRVLKQNFIFHKVHIYKCQYCKKYHLGKIGKILYDKFKELN
jgi:hypothetical protein